MNKFKEIDFEALSEKFKESEIEWRVQQSSKTGERIWAIVLPYVTNRAVQERLDKVCGPLQWRNAFKPGPCGGVLCGLSLKVYENFPMEFDNLNWLTKWDGADNTQVEGVKGGISNAMKRAGVQWGIGRYLYELDTFLASVTNDGKFKDYCKKADEYFKWDPPELPDWALTEAEAEDRKKNKSTGKKGTKQKTMEDDRTSKKEKTMLSKILDELDATMDNPLWTDEEKEGYKVWVQQSHSLAQFKEECDKFKRVLKTRQNKAQKEMSKSLDHEAMVEIPELIAFASDKWNVDTFEALERLNTMAKEYKQCKVVDDLSAQDATAIYNKIKKEKK